MRSVVSGLLLASVLLLSACSGPGDSAPPAKPAAFSIPLETNASGVLEARSAQVPLGSGEKTYTAQVAMTPTWWVTGDGFKIVWFAGKSQTKRFFQISGETPAGAPDSEVLKSPEEAVRQVKVSFDGAPPVLVKPEATRAVFVPPTGARTVTSLEILFGSSDRPVAYVWR